MISVVIATYNGELYLKQQLDSILSQLSNEDEVIISDDHSADQTVGIVESYHDPRLKLIMNDHKHRGYSGNFENALRHTKGSLIFMSDQDDVWLPGKVKRMVNALKHCDLVVSDAVVTDANLNVLYPSHFEHAHVATGLLRNFTKTRYIGACMAFKRSVLLKALPFPNNLKRCPHDYWISLIAEAFFKVELIQEPLINYRRHENNASSGGVTKSTDTRFNQVYRRLYCGMQLLIRSFR